MNRIVVHNVLDAVLLSCNLLENRYNSYNVSQLYMIYSVLSQ